MDCIPVGLPMRIPRLRSPPLLRSLLRVLRVPAACLLLWLALRDVDLGGVVDLMHGVPPLAWVLPTALLANSVVSALRIRVLLPAPRPALRDVLRAVLLGNFFGLALPTGGGEAAKAVALSRLSADPRQAVMALATARILELGPWGALLFWGAWAVLPGRLDAWVPLAWACGATMWAVLAAAGLAWWAFGSRLPAPGRSTLFWPGAPAIVVCACGALPFTVINCGVVYGLLLILGAGVTWSEVLGLIPAMDVVISLPVTLSGAGLREAMFATALEPWHISKEAAVAVAWMRWSGELFRALIGGVWWALSGRPVHVPGR